MQWRLLLLFMAMMEVSSEETRPPLSLTIVDGNPLEFAWFLTKMPSDVPSLSPTTIPSTTISSTPSMVASGGPTSAPSVAPTSNPTMINSNSPSSSPTLLCRDIPTYMSPLNRFTCDDHVGTDCFQWRFLGLNHLQVKELVEQCPIACNIDCGALEAMQFSFTFILSNMENFLSPESSKELESTMVDYLNHYVQPKLMTGKRFILYTAQLIKQTIIDRRGLRHQYLRREMADPLDLHVTVDLNAFSVDLSHDIINALLIEGIENPGMGLALRLTNDFVFGDTSVSWHQTQAPQRVQAEPPLENTSDISLIWFLMLSLVLLVGVSIYATMLVLRKKWGENDDVQHRRQASEGSPSERLVRIEHGDNTVSALGQVLSFETIVRVLSNCSPSSRASAKKSKDGESVNLCDDSNTSEASVSEHDDVGSTNEHPLTGIIPPMIVYNGIDGDDSSVVAKTKTVVPSRSVHAPSDFLDALMREEGCSVMDSSTYDGIVSFQSSCSSDEIEVAETVSADAGSVNENHLPLITQSAHLPPRPVVKLSKESSCRSPLRSLASGGRPAQPEVSLRPLPKPSLPARSSSAGSWEILEQDKVNSDHTPIQPPAPLVAPSAFSASPRKKWKIPFNLISADTPPTHLPECPDEDGDRLIFHAPRKGKLGLVIQCIDLKGPVVSHVKTYSPLLGQILPGDRILDIDGIRTTGMTLRDVTGIMGGKIAAQSNRRAAVFRIVAWRPATVTKERLLGRLDNNPESSALLLSDSPHMDNLLYPIPMVRRGSFGDVMRIS